MQGAGSEENSVTTLIRYMYENVENFKDKMEANGVRPEEIRNYEDLKKLPFITGEDLENVCELMNELPQEEALVIRGFNIYIAELEKCLDKIDAGDTYYRVEIDVEHNFDIIKVYALPDESMAEAGDDTIEALKEKISDAIYGVAGLKPDIFIESNRNFSKQSFSKTIVVDRRKMNNFNKKLNL